MAPQTPQRSARPGEAVARLDPVLEVSDLQTHFFTFGGTRVVKAVDRVSFTLHEGETLGLVPRAARIVEESIVFEGKHYSKRPSVAHGRASN
jgi:hypothetical protein